MLNTRTKWGPTPMMTMIKSSCVIKLKDAYILVPYNALHFSRFFIISVFDNGERCASLVLFFHFSLSSWKSG